MTLLCYTYILFDDQINKNHFFFFLTKTFGVGPWMASEVSVVLIPWVNQSSSMPMLLAVEEIPNAPRQGFSSDLNLGALSLCLRLTMELGPVLVL